jgi:hypothetical protein
VSSRRSAALAALAIAWIAPAATHAQDAPKGEPVAPEPPKQDGPTTGSPKPDAPKPAPPPAAEDAFRGSADDLVARFPKVVRIADHGRSAGGKPLRTLTVSASPDAEIEWAALVVARLSGLRPADESQLALDVAARLAAHAADLPPKTAVRFVFDASPDAGGVADAPSAGNATPTDDDRDGDANEDGPDDLDGDGRAGWMRFPDPAGDFADPDPKKAGEGPQRADAAKGVLPKWRIVREGRDDDGDGDFNEDGPGGVDVSRNFAAFFEEDVPAAGRWAVSEPETRAMMDLLLADERIAVVYELGAAETLGASPDWNAAWPKLPDGDVKLMEALRAAHGKGAIEKRKPKAPGGGSLAGVCWHQLGRLWLGRAPLDRSAPPWPAAGADPVNWDFRWTKLEGAAAKGLPPGTEIAHIALPPDTKPATEVFAETPSIAEFLTLLAKGRAEVVFTRTATSGEPGVLRIETRLANAGRLPTSTQRGVEVKGRRPLNVRVNLPAGAKLVAGKPLVQVERLAGGDETDAMRWVVAGPTGASVTIECVGPDTGRRTLEVKIP